MLFTEKNKAKSAKFRFAKMIPKRPILTLEFRHKKNNFFTYSHSFMQDEEIHSYNRLTQQRIDDLHRQILLLRNETDPLLVDLRKVLKSRIGSYRFKRLPENSNLLAQYSAGFIPGYSDKNSKRQKIKHVTEQLAELQASVLLNYINERLEESFLRNRRIYFTTKKIVKVARVFNLVSTYKLFKARNKPNTYFKLLYPRRKLKYSKKFGREVFFDYMYFNNYKHVKHDQYL